MRIIFTLIVLIIPMLSGCATLRKAHQADQLKVEIKRMQSIIDQLKDQHQNELSDLEKAQIELQNRLQKELSDYKAKLQMSDRGLVLTFMAEVFFKSGRAEILNNSKDILKNVAEVLKNEAAQYPVMIEGHTDNEPIKKSGWKSNWELAGARALSVLHFFIDDCAVQPERLSANSYGEFSPIVNNDMIENRQKNRRVEIVILPKKIEKIKETANKETIN